MRVNIRSFCSGAAGGNHDKAPTWEAKSFHILKCQILDTKKPASAGFFHQRSLLVHCAWRYVFKGFFTAFAVAFDHTFQDVAHFHGELQFLFLQVLFVMRT